MSIEKSTVTIDILVNAIRINEATGDHTIALARALQTIGHTVRIFAGTVGALPPDIRSITKATDATSYPANADLVIVQYGVWHPLAEQLRTCNAPSIFYYHGVTPPEHFSDSVSQASQQNSRQRADLVNQASVAVCTSPYTAHELSALTAYPNEQIKIVPLPIDVAAFAAPVESGSLSALRKQLKLEGKRVLLYVGRIAEHKRIDLLIDALAKLKPTIPNLHLLIVGNISASTTTRLFHESLQKQASQLNVSNELTFCGAVESTIPYYQLAELYLQASQHEGFCAPLVEAMAAGVPIVASDAGAMPWTLNAQNNDAMAVGLLFHAGDVESLVAQAGKVLSDEKLHMQLVQRGKDRALAFTRASFVENVRQILEEVRIRYSQPKSIQNVPSSELHKFADVALRNYKVRSNLPGIGRLIAWVRRNATAHLKEAYLDIIIEQQVNYNRQLATEVDRLQRQVEELQQEIIKIK